MVGDVSVCSRIEPGILLLVQTDTICGVNMAVLSFDKLLYIFNVAALARNLTLRLDSHRLFHEGQILNLRYCSPTLVDLLGMALLDPFLRGRCHFVVPSH